MSVRNNNNFRKKLIIFGIGGLILVLILIGFNFLKSDKFSVFKIKDAIQNQVSEIVYRQPKELITLSVDQQDLVDSFGQPDVFRLTMMDDLRHEIWTYYRMERSYVFINSRFVEDQIIEDIDEDFQFPQFKPTHFKAGLDLGEVEKILGKHSAEGELDPQILENAKIYDFYDQVKAGFKDDKLIFVQTVPVFIPEEFRTETKQL